MSEMKEIYFNKSDQLTVYSDGTHYELEWMSWGHDIKEYRKQIEQSDFESYKNGEHSGGDLIFKAHYSVWPPTENEKKEANRNFIRETPTALISDSSWKLFTHEELKKLIPIAEQQWIDWKGKLPDSYVSPIK